jgi:8-oxo-dGTP pyrophosphatase MutT (NUDIX family)
METLEPRTIYANKWMTFRADRIRRADGSEGEYSFIVRKPCAIIIPWDGTRLTLIEQYRYPLQGRFWEFPAGALDADEGEATGEEIARAELVQETGLKAGTMTPLGVFQIAPGITNQVCYAFLAEDLVQGPAEPDAEEVDLRVGQFSIADFWQMVREGGVQDGLSLAAMALWHPSR